MAHDLHDDGDLVQLLSELLDEGDPVPPAAVAAALAAREMCQVDGELAALVAADWERDPVVLRATPGAEAEVSMMTFVSARMTIEVEIGQDGYATGLITPPGEAVIELESTSRQARGGGTRVTSDELGRFRLEVGVGLCRMRVGTGPDAVLTAWFYC